MGNNISSRRGNHPNWPFRNHRARNWNIRQFRSSRPVTNWFGRRQSNIRRSFPRASRRRDDRPTNNLRGNDSPTNNWEDNDHPTNTWANSYNQTDLRESNDSPTNSGEENDRPNSTRARSDSENDLRESNDSPTNSGEENDRPTSSQESSDSQDNNSPINGSQDNDHPTNTRANSDSPTHHQVDSDSPADCRVDNDNSTDNHAYNDNLYNYRGENGNPTNSGAVNENPNNNQIDNDSPTSRSVELPACSLTNNDHPTDCMADNDSPINNRADNISPTDSRRDNDSLTNIQAPNDQSTNNPADDDRSTTRQPDNSSHSSNRAFLSLRYRRGIFRRNFFSRTDEGPRRNIQMVNQGFPVRKSYTQEDIPPLLLRGNYTISNHLRRLPRYTDLTHMTDNNARSCPNQNFIYNSIDLLSPPPSYDQVMAEIPPPSYNEVLQNERLYQTQNENPHEFNITGQNAQCCEHADQALGTTNEDIMNVARTVQGPSTSNQTPIYNETSYDVFEFSEPLPSNEYGEDTNIPWRISQNIAISDASGQIGNYKEPCSQRFEFSELPPSYESIFTDELSDQLQNICNRDSESDTDSEPGEACAFPKVKSKRIVPEK